MRGNGTPQLEQSSLMIPKPNIVEMLIILSSFCFLAVGVIGKPRPSELRGDQSDGSSDQGNSTFRGDIVPRHLRRDTKYRWPNGNVPIYIDPSEFADEHVESGFKIIHDAFKELEDVLRERGITDPPGSCQILFVWADPDNPPPNWLRIQGSSKHVCQSDFIGMKGGMQTVTLGPECMVKHVILHELLHVLGMHHQHASHNRNQFVKIHDENLRKGAEAPFEKLSSNHYTTYGVGYDYNSIMHYHPEFFAKTGPDGKPIGPVITPLDPSIKLKENTELTDKDKTKLNFMYCGFHTPPGWKYEKKEKI